MNRQQRRDDQRKLDAEIARVKSRGVKSLSSNELQAMALRIKRMQAAGVIAPPRKKNIVVRAWHAIVDRMPW